MRDRRNIRWETMDKTNISSVKLVGYFETYNRSEGKSPKTITWYKEALGEQQARLPGIDIAKIKREAYDRGYEKAFDEWVIEFPCAGCGEEALVVPNSECHKAVRQFLKKNWGHSECV